MKTVVADDVVGTPARKRRSNVADSPNAASTMPIDFVPCSGRVERTCLQRRRSGHVLGFADRCLRSFSHVLYYVQERIYILAMSQAMHPLAIHYIHQLVSLHF
jgi:hypothetical protein